MYRANGFPTLTGSVVCMLRGDVSVSQPFGYDIHPSDGKVEVVDAVNGMHVKRGE
jgi:hypothetical protein